MSTYEVTVIVIVDAFGPDEAVEIVANDIEYMLDNCNDERAWKATYVDLSPKLIEDQVDD